MEKRYQVFVSSTYEDLRPERQEIMQALLELDCIPAGMELFPAADDDQWTLIKRVIDDCDYYIVVVAGRYGSVGPEGISYTRMEYEYAIEQGKPVIGFLHKNPKDIPSGKTENDREKQEKLEEFRDFIKQKAVRSWETPQELGSVVSRSLIKLIKSNPAIGWIRANQTTSKEATEEILGLRKKVDQLESALNEVSVIGPKGTEHLSQGEDSFEVSFSFRTYDGEFDFDGRGYKYKFKTSWNDIFSWISPILINEASDKEIENSLDNYVRVKNMETIFKDKRFANKKIGGFGVATDDFNTVKVQFIALGLIRKNEKNRSVKDTNNYWTLTAYGNNVMMQLRAVKKHGDKKIAE